MRRAVWLTSLIAIVIAGTGLAGAWILLRPAGPPIVSASLSEAAISPNADGVGDVTHIQYVLRRPAAVSIYFEDSQGARYYFRKDKLRPAGPHQVDFGAVVDGYTLPDDQFSGQVLARVLRDGSYTWHISAHDEAEQDGQATGTLRVEQADTTLPALSMTVSPPVFTPNQDGISDRATINVWLDKEVGPAGLRVVLVGPDSVELPIAEKVGLVPYGGRGLHAYDYDGGVELGAGPPPDGSYVIKAVAEDRLGQKFTASRDLDIKNGGLPRATILFGNVDWSATTLSVGQTLYFTLTVENYGTAPIRTAGPWSGITYDSMSTNANTLGEYEESGAWRVGINCQTCLSDYPWRFALGTPDTLTIIPDENGRDQYYLLPGQRAAVTGGIVLDKIIPSRNPQYFWAGLIHEDVDVAPIDSRVAPVFVTILLP